MVRAELASALDAGDCVGRVDVHLFPGVSSVSRHSLLRHCEKNGIRPGGIDKAMPGVFLSQP